jgi:hypothetical protein
MKSSTCELHGKKAKGRFSQGGVFSGLCKGTTDLESQYVIETHSRLVQHTDSDQTSDQGVTLEQSLRVLVIELEEFTGSTSDLGEGEGDAPDLALVLQTVLADELEFGIEAGRPKRPPGDFCNCLCFGETRRMGQMGNTDTHVTFVAIETDPWNEPAEHNGRYNISQVFIESILMYGLGRPRRRGIS